jgi:hypothetical protein
MPGGAPSADGAPPEQLDREELPAVKRENQQPERGRRDRSRWNGG